MAKSTWHGVALGTKLMETMAASHGVAASGRMWHVMLHHIPTLSNYRLVQWHLLMLADWRPRGLMVTSTLLRAKHCHQNTQERMATYNVTK